MERILKNYIEICDNLDEIKYHALVDLFGKEMVDREIDSYLESKLKKDFSFENQYILWERFGYYLATLDNSVFEKIAVLKISLIEDKRLLRENRGGLSLEDEKKYGYHLLCRDYINICLDTNKNKVDMLKVFASIRSVEVKDYVINCFKEMYQKISRVSNYDKEMQNFLSSYQMLCKKNKIPYLEYDGEFLDEDILKEQVDMYVRYSIAKDKFISENKGLLYRVCSQLTSQLTEDVINEGYFGLLKAVEKFDIREGIAFSTYAGKGIKFVVWRYQNNSLKLIRLPAYLEIFIHKMNVFNYKYYDKYNRFPTDKEIALKLDISEKKVREIKHWVDQGIYTSLNKTFSNENGIGDELELIDVIVDDSINFTEEIIDNEFMNYVYEVIDSRLNEREKYILLENANGRSLKDIGNELGKTRERVRQINEASLKKIRRVSGIKSVNPYSK